METERMALSQRERDRIGVLHEIQQGHVTQVEGARRLHLSDRQVRRLLLRIAKHGDQAVVHGLRGRPSNRRLARGLEQKVLARVRQRYRDFGPTLASEHLAQEGLAVSRETLRKWMTQAAFWRPRSQRVKKIYVWRERRASFGELVMQDSSPFRWLEDRGPACQLIALIDDATSKFWARFTEQDTTEENLRTLRGWLERYGRPLAHYTDKNSIFRTTRRAGVGEQLKGERARSQFGRALKELGIEWIAAHSPQAKGRIEREMLNPMPKFDLLDETDKVRQGFLTRAQCDALYALLPEDLRDFSLFAYLTGMRLKEIKPLTWSDSTDDGGRTVLRLLGKKHKDGKATPNCGSMRISPAVPAPEGTPRHQDCHRYFHVQFHLPPKWQTRGRIPRELDLGLCSCWRVGKLVCKKCESEGPEKTCSAVRKGRTDISRDNLS